MSKASRTRKQRLTKSVRMCLAFCKANKISAGCANGEHGMLCGPSNCDVYRAVVRGERVSGVARGAR